VSTPESFDERGLDVSTHGEVSNSQVKGINGNDNRTLRRSKVTRESNRRIRLLHKAREPVQSAGNIANLWGGNAKSSLVEEKSLTWIKRAGIKSSTA